MRIDGPHAQHKCVGDLLVGVEVRQQLKHFPFSWHQITRIAVWQAASPGSLPVAPLYANADTLERCRDELAEVLEGWVLLGVSLHHPIPPATASGLRLGQVA